MKLASIGGSAAGMCWGQTPRWLDPNCQIAVVSEENRTLCPRWMALSYLTCATSADVIDDD